MRWRPFAGRLALLLISTLIGLTLAECGLRLYFWKRGVGRDDVQELLRRSREEPVELVRARGVFGLVQPSYYPDVVYELRPNLVGTFRGRSLRTNSHGMRGVEVTREKPPGTFRIAGIGDSYMFGWGVGQGETYLEILEGQLNELSAEERRFEVLNFAVPGYNTAIEAALYERKVRYFEPDLLLIHFIGNDFEIPHLLQAPRTLAPSQWYLVELVHGLFGRNPEEELDFIPRNLELLEEKLQEQTREQYRYMLGPKGFRRALKRIARLTDEDEIPVLLMMLGDLSDERQLVLKAARTQGFRALNPAPFFGAYLERAGLEPTRQSWKRAFHIPEDGHPTALAHQAYAEALLVELREMGIIGELASQTVAPPPIPD